MMEIADLYRDETHLNSPGQWLSGVTAASVMTGADPNLFGKPTPWYVDSAEFCREYIQVVRTVVAEVLTD
jgi:hypothetical protein